MINRMSVPICNCFHARWANISEINTYLEGYPSLTPSCAGLFKRRRSALGLLKSAFNAETFLCRLSWSIFKHFVAIYFWYVCCSQKFTKNPFFGGARSLLLIYLKSLSSVLVIIFSMSVPICNRFHTKRANSGKITCFRGYFSLTPSFEGNPRTQVYEILSRKTRVLGTAHGEDFVILACTVLIGLQSVMDERTDRCPGDG